MRIEKTTFEVYVATVDGTRLLVNSYVKQGGLEEDAEGAALARGKELVDEQHLPVQIDRVTVVRDSLYQIERNADTKEGFISQVL